MGNPDYYFSVEVSSGMKPAGKNTFPLLQAKDVAYKEGRLPDFLPIFLTQEEYDALLAAGEINENTPYFIRKEETSE